MQPILCHIKRVLKYKQTGGKNLWIMKTGMKAGIKWKKVHEFRNKPLWRGSTGLELNNCFVIISVLREIENS